MLQAPFRYDEDAKAERALLRSFAMWLLVIVLLIAAVAIGVAFAQPGADCRVYAKYASHFAYLRDLGARLELVTAEIARSPLELGQSHEQLQKEAKRVWKEKRTRAEAGTSAYSRCILVLGHFEKDS